MSITNAIYAASTHLQGDVGAALVMTDATVILLRAADRISRLDHPFDGSLFIEAGEWRFPNGEWNTSELTLNGVSVAALLAPPS
jgi:hypothetical protein